MANLLESYKGRLAIAEKYYGQVNNGAKLSNQKKMVTAMCLDNTAKFINEAFANSVGTQRADLGKFKIFAMDITTLALPNLIVNDLLMVVPMASFTGYLTYMEFALGTRKGSTGGMSANNYGDINGQRGDQYFSAMSVYDPYDALNEGVDRWDAQNIINSPFTGFGEMDEGRANYTGQAVIENIDRKIFDGAGSELEDKGIFKPVWTPVVKNAFGPGKDYKIIFEDHEEYGQFEEWVDTTDDRTGRKDVEAKVAAAEVPYDALKIAYKYDNEYIPATQLPTVVGRMKGIALQARVRRIAVYYSQLAAFQSKNDYGMDFESTISQQAQAELQYEIDGEAVYLLKAAADRMVDWEGKNENNLPLRWIDEAVDTISYSMKAESFVRVVEQASNRIYRRTKRFRPNWMLVGPEVMPILVFVPGFKAANASDANGAYIAGELNGLKVICTPMLEKECILGVLGNDGKTATGVYAPYMPIIPTQLLGFADGTMSQGFSTVYDMRILNPLLIEKIKIEDGDGMFLGQVQILNPESSEV